MMDKFAEINRVIVALDQLADMRGAEKCRLVLESIQRLAALIESLKKEEAEHAAQVAALEGRLKALADPPEVENDVETVDGRVYRIGVEGGGADVQRDAE